MVFYLGIGLVAAATIVYQVALTRIFSLAYGYHFAFLAMSLGLLGFGMSGTLLTLRPGWLKRVRCSTLGWLAAASSVTFAAGYHLANNVPLDPYRVGWDPGQLPLLALYLTVYALPFLLAGLLQGLPITAWPGKAGRIYAASLIGSGAGGLMALLALDLVRGPAVLTGAAAGAAAGALLLGRSGKKVEAGLARTALTVASIVLCAGLAAATVIQPRWLDVRMSEYKPLPQLLNYPDSKLAMTASGPESRVDVVDTSSIHSAPGLSFSYQGALPRQSAAILDGDRVMPLTPVDELEPAFFQALPSSLAYRLKPAPGVLVLEPGGGMEIGIALAGQAASVTALESNRLLADMLTGPLSERTGNIFSRPGVDLIEVNPRAYLQSTERRFDVISLGLSENRRSVAAGAFSLSENFLMTAEAFDAYIDHLEPGGLLAVHRWLQLPPTEEVRTAALVAESLERAGKEPADHMVAIRSFSTMLILAKTEPFTTTDLASVRAFADERQFDLVHVPGMRPSEPNRFNVLQNDRYTESFRALLADEENLYRDYEYDVRPPSDDRPFFFHFFKWAQIPTVLSLMGRTWQPFGGSGYLLVLGLLVVTTLLSALLILLPALLARRRTDRGSLLGPGTARTAVYFAMLGLGFLMVEVALVGRLLLILNHSTLAFSIVLFGLLSASGVGSFLSGRIPWRTAMAALVALVSLAAAFLSHLLEFLLQAALPVRIAGALILLAPIGLLMGVAFPKGLRWVAAERPGWLPMAWGVNGFTSVIGAVLAALVSLSWGFSVVLACGALAYLIALLAIANTGRAEAPS